jgi:hypothetical protein
LEQRLLKAALARAGSPGAVTEPTALRLLTCRDLFSSSALVLSSTERQDRTTGEHYGLQLAVVPVLAKLCHGVVQAEELVFISARGHHRLWGNPAGANLYSAFSGGRKKWAAKIGSPN